MKPIKIVNKIEEKEINWDIPQWVISKVGPTQIILTSENHNGITFQGTLLPTKEYPYGRFMKNYLKSEFKPLEGSLTITIEN